MILQDTIPSTRSVITSRVVLAFGLVAALQLAVPGSAYCQGFGSPLSALVQFRKLTPAERLSLFEKTTDKQVVPGNVETSDSGRTTKVVRGTITLIITERGSLEAVQNVDVFCKVKALNKNFTTTIKWIIDPGVEVKKGDKLVELDASGLREAQSAQEIDVVQAQAAEKKARENLKLIQAENAIDVRLMEIALQLAEQRLQRDKGADRDVKDELQLKVEQARLGLQRAQAQAKAKETAGQAELQAKAVAVDLENNKKNALVAELGNYVIRAPQDGFVIYYVPEQIRGGGSQQSIVAQGEPVREGQKLMQIPDLSHMQVNVRIYEAMVSHLHNADPMNKSSWQKASIRVDAYPNRILEGHVKTVDNVASQQDFFAADVKVYKTIVAIDAPLQGLRPGMSAEVHITAQQTSGLHVPLLAVLAAGQKRLCFVVTAKGIEEREVVTGLSNERVVEIKSGLKEGEAVLSSPRAWLRQVFPEMKGEDKPATGKTQSRQAAKTTILVGSVKPSNPEQRSSWVMNYGLTYQDLERIAALPIVNQAIPVRSFPQEARRLGLVTNAHILATTPEFAEINNLAPSEGRFLCDEDNHYCRNVAVLGSDIADQLFPGEEPLGGTLVINKSLYVVVGVLGDQKAVVGGPPAKEDNKGIYIPLRTCQARFGERVIIRRGNTRTAEAVPLHSILVTVRDPKSVADAVENLRDTLGQLHSIKDWVVKGPAGA